MREFNRLDRHSRVRLHAMALKSVRWVICESGKDLRSLEVVGVADDVGVDANGQKVAEPFLAKVCWKWVDQLILPS